MPSLRLPEKFARLLLPFAAFLIAMVYAVVIAPALQNRNANLARIVDIDALSVVLDQMPASFAENSPSELVPLRQRLTQTSSASNVILQRIDPQGASLSISIEEVLFSDLVGWLDHLTNAHGVIIQSAEIARRPEAGTVSARLLLEDAQ